MIELQNIVKNFKSKKVLKNVSLTIEEGNLVTIIGESGCGKTTLLKLLNRLEKPSQGKILINDKDIATEDVIELRRHMGYVIQQTGLFPHMTIEENIEIINTVQHMGQEERLKKTIEVMEMVGLNAEEYLHLFPSQLSGGQQQRVGVARAFASESDIILMDEPFSALDPMTRNDLQDQLVDLQDELKKTIVFVTHDMDEAIKISDKICIMKDGQVLQYDTPENILKNPIDDYVANFVGKNRIWSSPEYIKVKDIMIEQPAIALWKTPVFRCIERMKHHKVNALLIVSKDRQLKGIVRATHLRNLEDKNQPVQNVMMTEFPRLKPDDNILDAIAAIKKNSPREMVPVVDENDILAGLITKSSLVTTLSQQYLEEVEDDA